MLKLKPQNFSHLMWSCDSFEKTLMLRKIEGGRRRGRQRMRCLDVSPTQRTWVWVNSGHWWWTGRPGMLQSMGSQGVRHGWVIELNWTALWLLGFPHSQWHPLIAPLVLRENSTAAPFYCGRVQRGPTVFQILCWAWHWPHTAYKATRKKYT